MRIMGPDLLNRLAMLMLIELGRGDVYRGLPHAHILVMLHPDDKPRSGEELDGFVCAEIPPHEGRLRAAVLRHMLHGECGPGTDAPCMDKEDQHCTKHFPKDFAKETEWRDDAEFPIYRRRAPEDGGVEVQHNGRLVDNRWVVPYNPFLLLKFDCHINVEHCNTVRACKYLFKVSDGRLLECLTMRL